MFGLVIVCCIFVFPGMWFGLACVCVCVVGQVCDGEVPLVVGCLLFCCLPMVGGMGESMFVHFCCMMLLAM